MWRVRKKALATLPRKLPKTIFRSKAVGEPPLMLAISSWLAIRDAISNYKGDNIVKLNAPATPEEILKSINS